MKIKKFGTITEENGRILFSNFTFGPELQDTSYRSLATAVYERIMSEDPLSCEGKDGFTKTDGPTSFFGSSATLSDIANE